MPTRHLPAWSNKDSKPKKFMTVDDSSPAPIAGALTAASIPPQLSLNSIEATLRTHIASWSPAAMNVESPLTANERTLASSLCVHLTQKTREDGAPSFFHHETPQGRRSLDMTAFPSGMEGIVVDNHACHRSEFFYAIEAKILPLVSARAREYVISDHENTASPIKKLMGGIERFKQGAHAPKLARSSIVAFVQNIPATPWMAVINGWINELIPTKPAAHSEPWSASDHLVAVSSSDRIDEYYSNHTRPSPALVPIRMRHFLLYLAGKN
jgi:hypothetical protein